MYQDDSAIMHQAQCEQQELDAWRECQAQQAEFEAYRQAQYADDDTNNPF